MPILLRMSHWHVDVSWPLNLTSVRIFIWYGTLYSTHGFRIDE